MKPTMNRHDQANIPVADRFRGGAHTPEPVKNPPRVPGSALAAKPSK